MAAGGFLPHMILREPSCIRRIEIGSLFESVDTQGKYESTTSQPFFVNTSVTECDEVAGDKSVSIVEADFFLAYMAKCRTTKPE